MSKVKVTGNALVVTSSLKWEDLILVAAHRPDELNLYTDETKTNQIFAIKLLSPYMGTTGAISDCAVVFEGPSRDEGKKAIVSVLIDGAVACDCDDNDLKEYVAAYYGEALANLNKLENNLPSVIAEIKKEKEKIMEAIEIA